MSASIIAAFAFPAETQVSQRVPKKLLLENGAPTASDKRAIHDGIEEIFWVAALKPTNIGVPAYRDVEREYLEIVVLVLTLRTEAKSTRLIELIHRSIPYPLVLVAVQGNLATLSFAHKRLSQAESGQTVIDSLEITAPFCAERPSPAESAFLTSLALVVQPQQNLHTLYQGWLDRVIALKAADFTGAFILRETPAQTDNRRLALAEHERLQREIDGLRAQAERETQLNRRVDLNLKIRGLEAQLANAFTNL